MMYESNTAKTTANLSNHDESYLEYKTILTALEACFVNASNDIKFDFSAIKNALLQDYKEDYARTLERLSILPGKTVKKSPLKQILQNITTSFSLRMSAFLEKYYINHQEIIMSMVLHLKTLSEDKRLLSVVVRMLSVFDKSTILFHQFLLKNFVIPKFKPHVVWREDEKTTDDYTTNFIMIEGDEAIATCKIQRKREGAQFGAVLNLAYLDPNSIPKRYYVKAHQGYAVSTSRSNMMQYVSSGSAFPPNPMELLVYKILEQLKVGPKVDFLFNPLVRSGLFIVTEDLVKPGQSIFMTAEALEKREKVENKSDEISEPTFLSVNEVLTLQRTKEHINRLDILRRILSLGDYNMGNYGCCINLYDYYDIKWMLIDFTIAKDSDYELTGEDEQNFNGFVKGNSSFHYIEDGILSRTLKNRPVAEKVALGKTILNAFSENNQLRKTIDNAFIFTQTFFQKYFSDVSLNGLKEYQLAVIANFEKLLSGMQKVSAKINDDHLLLPFSFLNECSLSEKKCELEKTSKPEMNFRV